MMGISSTVVCSGVSNIIRIDGVIVVLGNVMGKCGVKGNVVGVLGALSCRRPKLILWKFVVLYLCSLAKFLI